MSKLDRFTQLVTESHGGLRYFLQRLGVSPSSVDDLAQEVFLVAYRRWDELEEVEYPEAWLKSVARNLVMNEVTKRNRRQRLLDAQMTSLLLEYEETRVGADEWLEMAERREALRGCLERLGEQARKLVEARYFQGLTSEQIGLTMKMKGAAVRKSLFLTRKFLADCLRHGRAGDVV